MWYAYKFKFNAPVFFQFKRLVLITPSCTTHCLLFQTYTKCERTGVPIPTMACQPRKKTRMASGLRCEVKSAVDCNCTSTEQCVDIAFEECQEKKRDDAQCQDTSLRVPYQPRIHRVKCLLADDNASPDLDVEEREKEADAQFDQLEAQAIGAGGGELT